MAENQFKRGVYLGHSLANEVIAAHHAQEQQRVETGQFVLALQLFKRGFEGQVLAPRLPVAGRHGEHGKRHVDAGSYRRVGLMPPRAKNLDVRNRHIQNFRLKGIHHSHKGVNRVCLHVDVRAAGALEQRQQKRVAHECAALAVEQLAGEAGDDGPWIVASEHAFARALLLSTAKI